MGSAEPAVVSSHTQGDPASASTLKMQKNATCKIEPPKEIVEYENRCFTQCELT